MAKYGEEQAMSQFDMVGTQWAFVGPLFIFPERMGIPHISREDLEAVAHLFYVVGHVLGIRDDFNLCAGTVEEVRRKSSFVHENVIKPNLKTLHPLGGEMARNLIRGMVHFSPFLNHAALTAGMLKAYEADSYGEAMSEVGKSKISLLLYHTMECLNGFLARFPTLGRLLIKTVIHPILNLNWCVVSRWKKEIEKFIEKEI